MDLETDFAKELEVFRKRCLELEEKSKNYEMRCLMLEVEVENLKKKNVQLEGKITFVELLIENKVLECEKTKAETEVCSWKEKVKELTSRMCEWESNIKGTNEKVHEDVNVVLKETKEESRSQVRKRLAFEEDGCVNKRLAPSTPGVGKQLFAGFIDISDEDLCDDDIRKKCSDGKRKRAMNIVTSDDENDNADEEDTEGFKVHSLNTRSAKRNRDAKIITSDDDTSCDDNALICALVKTRHSSRLTKDSENEVLKNGSKRYLTRLRKSESKNVQDVNKTVCLHGNSSSEDEEDNDEGSESEGASLGGFIVDSCESISEGASKSGGSCDESEDDYRGTLDKIGRKKVSNMKWDLEGDMLADFGKDPELCMRAVCALYRQQTEDEKVSKETIYHNERGFSQPDAFRASKLAEFLTEGDPGGDLNRTVEELKRYDSKGIKLCMKLAVKYSKQLFKIYQNKEDKYFLPR